MRVALCATLCLVLVATAYAKDLALGQCGDNDTVLVDRNIRRPAIPGIPMYAKLIARAPARSSITCVNVKSTDGTDPDVTVIKGGVGHRFVFILVRGQRGEGLNIQFTARAHSRLTTTTSKPTTESSSLPTIPTGVPTTQTPAPSSAPPSPTTEKVPETTQTPEPTSPPATPTVNSSTSSSEPPSSSSPAPTSTTGAEDATSSETTSEPTAIPTGIPTLSTKDGDDDDVDDADLAELLSFDSLAED